MSVAGPSGQSLLPHHEIHSGYKIVIIFNSFVFCYGLCLFETIEHFIQHLHNIGVGELFGRLRTMPGHLKFAFLMLGEIFLWSVVFGKAASSSFVFK